MPVNIVLNKDPRFTSSCLGGTPPIVKYVLSSILAQPTNPSRMFRVRQVSKP